MKTVRATLRSLAISLGIDDFLRSAIVETRLSGERVQRLVGRAPGASDAILLVASGRSGTTWLADLLATVDGVQQVFEPLHPVGVPEVQKLTGWDEGRHPHIRSFYLRPDSQDPGWRDLMARVLSGRVRNYWTDYARTSYLPKRLLIKMIRANLMLGYLYDTFHPTIVYVARHPCAVVASRLGIPWHADVRDILEQEELVEDHLRPWIADIEKETDPVGAHAVWWAVENLVAIRDLSERPHRFLFYEEVCLEPERQLDELCEWLGIDRRSLPREGFERPSRMARENTLHRPSLERLGSWTRKLSNEDRERILGWAARVGIDWYHDDPLPRIVGRNSGGRSPQ